LQPASTGAASGLRAPAPSAPGEAWWALGQGRDKIRLTLPAGAAETGQPLAAVLPIDAATPSRLRALERLWRHLDGGPPLPDPITSQRRRRLKAMLRALDGRACGAAYREIAAGLYGAGRITAEPWKTSSLRDSTLRLVRDGAGLVQGGYVDFLTTRRRLPAG